MISRQSKNISSSKKKGIKKKTIIDLKRLLEIKGIGIETLKDIKRIYNNISELKRDLRNDKVPLRNDVVRKLKKYFKIR